MSGEFMVVHPETGEEYGLSDVAAFTELYQPRGFVIAEPQPDGWQAPAVPGKRGAKAAASSGASSGAGEASDAGADATA